MIFFPTLDKETDVLSVTKSNHIRPIKGNYMYQYTTKRDIQNGCQYGRQILKKVKIYVL